jgi:hypothetical protein
MTEQEKNVLRNIPILRMESKSDLEKYRYLMSVTDRNYEKEINIELDKINWLNRLEEDLMTKK